MWTEFQFCRMKKVLWTDGGSYTLQPTGQLQSTGGRVPVTAQAGVRSAQTEDAAGKGGAKSGPPLEKLPARTGSWETVPLESSVSQRQDPHSPAESRLTHPEGQTTLRSLSCPQPAPGSLRGPEQGSRKQTCRQLQCALVSLGNCPSLLPSIPCSCKWLNSKHHIVPLASSPWGGNEPTWIGLPWTVGGFVHCT